MGSQNETIYDIFICTSIYILYYSKVKYSGETIDVRVVHRSKWTGSTGTMDKVRKDNIYTIQENSMTKYGYHYDPLYGNPDYNPRILTLLFDVNSTSVKAAIGDLREEAGPSIMTHSAEWVGCSHAVLSEAHPVSKLYFETRQEDYTYSGSFGSGSETLELSLVKKTTTTKRTTTTTTTRNMSPIVNISVNF